MKVYPKYKPSGVDWLGEIPETWDRYRIKFFFNSINGGVWGEEPIGNENDMICIRVADFDYNNGVINLNKLTTRNISLSEQKGRVLKKGDLLIEKSGGGELSPVGRVVKFGLDVKAVCSNFINRLNTKNTFSPDFLNYLNKFLYAKGLTEICINQTIGIQNLKTGEFLGKTVFVPSLSEQQNIVDFLDYKTGQCDRFIANRQKQIELLNEQKAAIINKAVTKGINPNAKMKPSGIEWIGDIPEHWCIWKMTRICEKIGDGLHGTPVYEEGSGIFFVNGNNLSNGKIEINENTKEVESTNFNLIKKEISLGSVLYSINGTIGNIAIYNGENILLGKSAAFFVCRSKIINLYLFHYLTSNSVLIHLNSTTEGTTIKNVSLDTLRSLKIPLPSLEEQEYIINFIKKETSKIETLIAKYQKQIDLMQEYRTALISQAVTGKIDVRDWQLPRN